MLKLLCPDIYINSIFDIDTKNLKESGIKGILLDLDNTLLDWSQTYVPKKVKEWVNKLKAEGFLVCIVSNNKAKRIKRCSDQLGVPAVWGHYKPFSKAFKKGMAFTQTFPDETAVVGDQIFTDILGAKRLGMFAILVKPMSGKEFLWTKLMRSLEKIVLYILLRKKLIPETHM